MWEDEGEFLRDRERKRVGAWGGSDANAKIFRARAGIDVARRWWSFCIKFAQGEGSLSSAMQFYDLNSLLRSWTQGAALNRRSCTYYRAEQPVQSHSFNSVRQQAIPTHHKTHQLPLLTRNPSSCTNHRHHLNPTPSSSHLHPSKPPKPLLKVLRRLLTQLIRNHQRRPEGLVMQRAREQAG